MYGNIYILSSHICENICVFEGVRKTRYGTGAEQISRDVTKSHSCTSSRIFMGRLEQLPAAFAWQVVPA